MKLHNIWKLLKISYRIILSISQKKLFSHYIYHYIYFTPRSISNPNQYLMDLRGHYRAFTSILLNDEFISRVLVIGRKTPARAINNKYVNQQVKWGQESLQLHIAHSSVNEVWQFPYIEANSVARNIATEGIDRRRQATTIGEDIGRFVSDDEKGWLFIKNSGDGTQYTVIYIKRYII